MMTNKYKDWAWKSLKREDRGVSVTRVLAWDDRLSYERLNVKHWAVHSYVKREFVCEKYERFTRILSFTPRLAFSVQYRCQATIYKEELLALFPSFLLIQQVSVLLLTLHWIKAENSSKDKCTVHFCFTIWNDMNWSLFHSNFMVVIDDFK